MRTLIVLCVLLAIVWANPAGKEQQPKLTCSKVCTADYTPVCGLLKDGKGSTITFGNSCVMENYNCETSKSYVVKQQGECGDKSPVRLS
ncbi:turripeptide Pal9.2 [Anopheles ziemanni]|uniref:turripeptide Pal9.2 n=1 Tax=Anopheles coustani TaxID=139045 RepID=UPI00265A441E|nr:turripeptide Pal9.2 [Anopheles coustani]XP_058176974.1 turripeptide Pal9.2 [Anopheles ziemanni]